MDREIEKKKWSRKRIIKYSSIGLFVLIVGYFVLFQAGGSTLNVQTDHLTISTVHRGPFQEFIPVQGEILPMTTIYLDAEEGGIVDKIFLEAGLPVKKNDPILKLTNTTLLMDIMYREAEFFQQINNLRNTRLQLEQNRLSLESQVAEINFQLQKQKRKYERYQVLWDEKLISHQDFEDTQDEYELLVSKIKLILESKEKDLKFREQQIAQLEISVERMQTNLNVAKLKLDNLTIRAPITGVLTSLKAEVGQSKSLGERLGQIDAQDGFKIRAEIDEFYIDRISKGYSGQSELADKTYQLRVTRIFPEVNGGKFMVEMEFMGKHPQGLRRGQSIHIRLELGDVTQATLLSRGGFFQKTGGNWVYVLQGDMKTAVKRTIHLGRQNPDVFEVLDGLKLGEQVITSSYDGFGDNERLVLK